MAIDNRGTRSTTSGEATLDERSLLKLLEGLRAARDGDFSVRLTPRGGGLQAEVAHLFNGLLERNDQLARELVRVGKIIGREGRMTERAALADPRGSWRTSVDSLNALIDDLVRPTTEVARVIVAVAEGDLSQKMALKIGGQPVKGEFLRIGTTVNTMVDQLSAFADEVTRVAREVGTEGKLGGQAEVEGVSGTWKDLTESVNFMASNLTAQVRNIAQVTTAVAQGDLTQKITVDVKGEILELKNTINTMVDQLSSFADEVTRVAREVGTEGKLGGQAEVQGVSGTWRGLTESVNGMANNLTDQVRNIAQVTTAVAQGDLTQKITVEAKGEVAALADTINSMTDTLRAFAEQVTSVAREVGTEGVLGGQAEVPGVAGTWKDLTDSVNGMASNLTDQVRAIAQVATAVAQGDLSQKITVEAKGEVAALADTINSMTDTLSAFADEVTRVAHEVGTEGELGGQAGVPGVAGTWKDLTESVNSMASNLTAQVRNIAQVTTAVAQGDLTQKITADVKGEILELKNTINTMVDQLSSFADEVTRVAREVGTEGKLGGQAEVQGVSGTWRGLTENVNQLAGNLTTQVRAIAEVSTAVTQGDLTRSITVQAQGEVAELKDNINQMIANLRDTTKRNEEQDWLKTNLARISSLMQGQRELATVTQLIMSELTPTVSARHGAFFLVEPDADGSPRELRLIASYGYSTRDGLPSAFALGESLVGQAALDRRTITIDDAPGGYIQVSSGLGAAPPASIIILPVLFEDQVLGVIELAWLRTPSEINRTFLEQLMETLGVALNTIIANMRTEELLQQSQSLNAELEQQAQLLEERNRDIETKNLEIEQARLGLEEKATQLALSSRYKSEFLVNMSHELRTPLNSLLILSKLLVDNESRNLSDKQLEFARTIHAAGSDLLELINDILDLSKIEAGKMDLVLDAIPLADVCAYVRRTFEPVASDKGLPLEVTVAEDVPTVILTDEQRLQQILRNLLSNAFKFTTEGKVALRVARAGDDEVIFSVTDTGIGIAEEKLAVIFEAFQQADGTTSRTYGGTGLGLSISRELARALGGEIEVQSTVGVGSTFSLRLTLSAAHRTQIGEPAGPERAAVRSRRSELALTASDNGLLDPVRPIHVVARRLLVLDQDGRTVDAIRRLVGRDHGVELAVAPTASELLALIDDDLPAGLILGGGMTKSAIFSVLESIPARRRTDRLPVVLWTGKPLTARETARLRRLEPALLPAVVDSDDALRAETALLLHPGVGRATTIDLLEVPEASRLQGRILLVDDDVRNLFALASLLEERGLEVIFSETGAEALEILRSNPTIDLVLMDIMMPQMDGYETIRAARQMPQAAEMPIIAVTAKAMHGDREKSIEAGASDYITKPVDPARLISMVSTWLASAQHLQPSLSQ